MNHSFQIVSAESVKNLCEGKAVFLDVRTEMEHAEKCLAAHHYHVPLDRLKPRDFMATHGFGDDYSVYIICRSGGRARKAAEAFAADGYANVFVVDGGLTACEACGHDVKAAQTATGKRPISLERQVRIAAGAIAAAGSILAMTVAPGFAPSRFWSAPGSSLPA